MKQALVIIPIVPTRLTHALAGVVLALALSASACSDGDDGVASEGLTASSADVDSTDSTESTDPAGSTAATASSSTSSSTSSSSSASNGSGSDSPLLGDPWDGFADQGDVLAVLGVAHDDVLNVRSVPGTGGEVVATLSPTADDVVATGRARQLERSFWYEVTVERGGSEITGWVSVHFVAYEGGTDDATAEFLDGGSPPEVETMQQLGELVAAGFASVEPASDIVQSVAPTVGDLGEVTYDVVGLGDDAGAGYRLHIFATPSNSGEGFTLRTIERTWYCLRGLSGELCV